MLDIYSPDGRHILDSLGHVQCDKHTFNDIFDPNDLSNYTEAKFFDFDMGQPAEDATMNSEKNMRGNEAISVPNIDLGLKGAELDFLNDFDNFDFQSLITGAEPTITLPMSTPHSGISPPPNAGASSTSSSPTPFTPRPAKRKASADPESLEEASRLAADEDKRRRNTAASARFRVKKKQREQALERTAKEMTDKCLLLEQRINRLEMENKWLKGLIVEKNNAPGDEDPSVVFAARYSAAVKNGEVDGYKDDTV